MAGNVGRNLKSRERWLTDEDYRTRMKAYQRNYRLSHIDSYAEAQRKYKERCRDNVAKAIEILPIMKKRYPKCFEDD